MQKFNIHIWHENLRALINQAKTSGLVSPMGIDTKY